MTAGARLSVPLDGWPEADRAAWAAAFTPGDIFGDEGQGLHYSATSRRNFYHGYARWLGFLSLTCPASLENHPLARVTPERLDAFLKDVSRGRKAITVYNAACHLASALRIMYPGADVGWLRSVINRLAQRITPRGTPMDLDSAVLFNLGIELMEGNRASTIESSRARVRYRDGLIIALLAARPLRRRSFAALTLDRHLRRIRDTWMILLGRDDIKTGEPLEFPFPEILVLHLEYYLAEVRPRFHGADRHSGLWPTCFATQMTGDALHETVRNRTRAGLGRPVCLHDFRRAAATTIAVHAPQHSGSAQHLLGHRHFATTQDHYILARNLEAGRRHHATVASLRRNLGWNRQVTYSKRS